MSNSSFASSLANGFITSLGKARGTFKAGAKTMHAICPTTGFGNTINNDGTCSLDPTLGFTYTKLTVEITWNFTANNTFAVGSGTPSGGAILQIGSGPGATDVPYPNQATSGSFTYIADYSSPNFTFYGGYSIANLAAPTQTNNGQPNGIDWSQRRCGRKSRIIMPPAQPRPPRRPISFSARIFITHFIPLA